jgi:glycosyltransferase involved in cell wall biosynthesis
LAFYVSAQRDLLYRDIFTAHVHLVFKATNIQGLQYRLTIFAYVNMFLRDAFMATCYLPFPIGTGPERGVVVPASKFSIIITCHNQAQMIHAAVDSALHQFHPLSEVIVVDDASTDNSCQVLEAYGERIHLVRSPSNQGAARARNAGAAAARGDYLVFLDGDDALQPWALTIYQRIVRACKPKLILGTLQWFKEHLPTWFEPTPKQIAFVNYEYWADKDRTFRSSASALVIERGAFESVQGWSEEVVVFEDQYLETKLAYSGRAVQVISPATVLYRVHDSNTTNDTWKLISSCHGLLSAFRASRNPSAWGRRLRSSALIGGPAFWVMKRAYRAGFHGEACKLLLRAWPMVSLTALTRLQALLFGRRPTQFLATSDSPVEPGQRTLPQDAPRSSHRAA